MFLQDVSGIGQVFDHAIALHQKGIKSIESVSQGSLRLYSGSTPNTYDHSSLWFHISPWLIRNRLEHISKKAILFFTPQGHIHDPVFEIQISEENELRRIVASLTPLTPAYFPALSCITRFMLRKITFILKQKRKYHGENVLLFYSAYDQTYFGSVYIGAKGAVLSIKGRDRSAIESGIRYIISHM
ncbi:MAG: hypothetical protein G01um101448_888 [Parcubacteria group bacterium Gr01-1014_48]|nr:MAG: hypothetical protein Greene041614_61 [Parcubacteria group bacterium Greene0416_14]TSC72930.1 MAG: hypothetical protein G01um101448_888 [Parcubacteria group bacterium Gr01-1014_48]TSD01502.1 MAG: hypothetical protein Greene101415_218 [Parcubacteria group bacterium Greene1014_15]TSD08324.1 MAG: hypothetical protein Greene07144_175 [Parcubacteria group bacterium Greene0714_4]